MGDHEASLEKVYAAESRTAGIRVLIVALNSVVYHFLMAKEGTIPSLAYFIILAANVYSLSVFFLKPYRRFPAMLSSYFTSGLDAGFITLWLAATGGADSPFFVLWYVSVSAIAFRYGYRATLGAALLYSVSYLGMSFLFGHVASHATELIVRIAYIFFTAAVGGLLAQESFRQTREKIKAVELAEALRESEERFRMLSDATFEGVAIHDNGHLLEVNRSFALMFGHQPHELVGRQALELVAPESRELLTERIRAAQADPFEVTAHRRDGTRFELELMGRDLPYHGRMVRVVAARDITERRHAERATRESEALKAVNARLQEVDRMKTQFINHAAHELGTPLTPMKLQMHLLRSDNLGPVTERQRKALDVVQRNLDHLNLLVKDLLEAARLQSGHLSVRKEEVDVAILVHEAIESYEEVARGAGVALDARVEGPLVVAADRGRLGQVMHNLLSNAIKFTPSGGRVLVEAGAADGRAWVRVDDTGIGIAPLDLGKLFQPFSQVHDKMERTRSGTGLGLYISRGIAEQHGGSLVCESAGLGKGTTFTLRIPLAPSALRVEATADSIQ